MAYRMRRSTAGAALLAAGLLAVGAPPTGAGAAVAPRIDLRVLVVDDGGGAVEAVESELRGTGVPYTVVRLDEPGRPVIDAGFLADAVDGRPRGKYQGVVLPNADPFGAGSAETAALTAYEKTFGVRQVDAYTWAHPGVGLDRTGDGGYAGTLDGVDAAVTPAGKAGPFGYLDGAIGFEDNAPSVGESYGYAGRPARATPATWTCRSPAAEGNARASSASTPTTGAASWSSPSRTTSTSGSSGCSPAASSNGSPRASTSGRAATTSPCTSTTSSRDSRWDTELNCTPGDFDCGGGEGEGTVPVRMTAQDAQYAAQWQQGAGFTLDMVYNAGAGEAWKAANGGSDPLTAQLLADRARYRWVNHTYTHPFLGCVQDTSAVPWQCAKDAAGSTRWMSRAEISAQIRNNHDWAVGKGIALDRTELVTGEHSGLKTLPQQPEDNPNLAGALADNGVKWIASDNSRESRQRSLGSALTVPRHPMNVYYNVGTAAEMTDEYNWIYTSRADGGSGVCETSPGSTCLDEPLDTATGYATHIVPQEARTALGHVIANDPRPHYVHQSNLAEGRILYPVLDKVLGDYRSLFADNTPVVNPRHRDAGSELARRAAWDKALADGKVTAYRIGTTVTVQSPQGTAAPVTAPEGTRRQLLVGTDVFGTAYAGQRSAWASPEPLQRTVTLRLPA